MARIQTHPQRRVYGRRLSRPLHKQRQNALDTLLPELQIDPANIFPEPFKETWLEIGFGNGEHLAALMREQPCHGFIGAEPFINGMAAFLKEIKDDPHDNIRVWMDDAILLIDSLPDQYLNGIYVLNPDPWPKKRHHKRRIINQENLDRYARILKPGGQLIMTTDVDDLAAWMVTQSMRHPAFTWTAQKADDWRIMPEDWIKTRYEQKGTAAGRQQTYLFFKKTGDP